MAIAINLNLIFIKITLNLINIYVNQLVLYMQTRAYVMIGAISTFKVATFNLNATFQLLLIKLGWQTFARQKVKWGQLFRQPPAPSPPSNWLVHILNLIFPLFPLKPANFNQRAQKWPIRKMGKKSDQWQLGKSLRPIRRQFFWK